MRIQQIFYAQLPAWARPDHAVLRYVRGQTQWRQIGCLMLLSAVLMVGVVGINLLGVQTGQPLGTGGLRKWDIFNIAYFPVLVMQQLAIVVTLVLATTVVTAERRRGTWEDFMITSHGAELIMRARWAVVFYQLRGLLFLLMIPRVIFIGLMLVDVTDFEGYHLDLYLSGTTPEVPLEVAVIMLAALMTAALLQFPVLIGLNAAFGLLIAARLRHTLAVFMARFILVIVEIIGVWLALKAGWQVLNPGPSILAAPPPMGQQWADLMLMGTLGDQGLRLMDLETTLQTWPDVDYGVFAGGALLLAVVIQMALTRALLALAARQAARPLKE
jgi:hypothetical protein